MNGTTTSRDFRDKINSATKDEYFNTELVAVVTDGVSCKAQWNSCLSTLINVVV
jgi:hypothetical protein